MTVLKTYGWLSTSNGKVDGRRRAAVQMERKGKKQKVTAHWNTNNSTWNDCWKTFIWMGKHQAESGHNSLHNYDVSSGGLTP